MNGKAPCGYGMSAFLQPSLHFERKGVFSDPIVQKSMAPPVQPIQARIPRQRPTRFDFGPPKPVPPPLPSSFSRQFPIGPFPKSAAVTSFSTTSNVSVGVQETNASAIEKPPILNTTGDLSSEVILEKASKKVQKVYERLRLNEPNAMGSKGKEAMRWNGDEPKENELTADDVEGDKLSVFLCEACNVVSIGKEALMTHVNSKKHEKNLGTTNMVSVGKEMPYMELSSVKEICLAQCDSKESLIQEMVNGYSQPLIGLEFLLEFFTRAIGNPCYVCNLCDIRFVASRDVFAHFTGSKHRIRYLRTFFDDIFRCDIEHAPKADKPRLVEQKAAELEEAGEGRPKIPVLVPDGLCVVRVRRCPKRQASADFDEPDNSNLDSSTVGEPPAKKQNSALHLENIPKQTISSGNGSANHDKGVGSEVAGMELNDVEKRPVENPVPGDKSMERELKQQISSQCAVPKATKGVSLPFMVPGYHPGSSVSPVRNPVPRYPFGYIPLISSPSHNPFGPDPIEIAERQAQAEERKRVLQQLMACINATNDKCAK